MRYLATIVSTLVLAISLASMAGAQTLPASWAGVWETEITEKDCFGVVDSMYTETDTLCTGDEIGPDPDEAGDLFLDCISSISDTELNVECSGDTTFLGCTMEYSFTIQGTRTGDSFEGTERVEITYTGDCFDLEDECYVVEITGLRIGPEPPTCGTTPVLATTWGRIKAHFR